MQHALSHFHVDGLGNNIAFWKKIVRCDSFKQANLDTNLIQREEQFLFSPANIKPELVVATAFIEFLSKMQNNQSTQKQLWLAQPLWRSNVTYQHSIKLNFINQNIQIKFSAAEHGFNAEFNGQQYHITGQLTDYHTANIQIDGIQQKLSLLTEVCKALLYLTLDKVINSATCVRIIIKLIVNLSKDISKPQCLA